jgi:phosphotransferase system  glucose/maltose/N-acetylglucosamine-specific IIC component
MVTMLLGGLWHGAGWTFIVWGLLHGLYLVINHSWNKVSYMLWPFAERRHAIFGRLVTFLAVTVAWSFFRASSLDQGISVLSGMLGLHGMVDWGKFCDANGPCGSQLWVAWSVIGALLLISQFAPNTQESLALWQPTLGSPDVKEARSWMITPSFRWAVVIGSLLALSLATLNEHSQFLYYQF